MGLAHERQHVVLAHAVEADVADQDDFVAFLGEELPQVATGILVQTGEQFGVHPRDPRRGLPKSLAVGILADGQEDFPHRPLDPRVVHADGVGAGRRDAVVLVRGAVAGRFLVIAERFHE